MDRKSIFEIERRSSLCEYYTGFYEDVKNTLFPFSDFQHGTVMGFLDRCIKYWPYRKGASSIRQYLFAIGIDVKNPNTDMDILLAMELLINLLHWAPRQFEDDHENDASYFLYEFDEVNKEIDRLLLNADFILEQCCNMQVQEIQAEVPKYVITKRDSLVDAVIEKNPGIANDLLGYLDIRNVGDNEYKESVLVRIYGYMEPKRKKYKSMEGCGSISDEFFLCMNRLGIRHKVDSQMVIPEEKKTSVYDKLFKMALYVLLAAEVNDYKKDLKSLREKDSSHIDM